MSGKIRVAMKDLLLGVKQGGFVTYIHPQPRSRWTLNFHEGSAKPYRGGSNAGIIDLTRPFAPETDAGGEQFWPCPS